MSHRTSQFLALMGMIIMFTLSALTAMDFFGPNAIGSTSNDTAPLIVPAPYAFAIWSPIYLGLLIFPIYQLFKNRDNHPNWIPIRQWFAANTVLNGVWLVFASYDWQWLTVVVITVMLVSLFRINQLLREMEAAGTERSYWLERLVFSLYFAWITLATVLNVSSALNFYDWAGFGISEVTWTIVMIVIAALIAGFTSRQFRDSAYASVVVWAFVALARKHWETTPTLAYLAIAVVVVFAGMMVWNWPGRRREVVVG